MHRDQIRLFPGDVESQVRRLALFDRLHDALAGGESHDTYAQILDRQYLDYAVPVPPRWQRWLDELWQQLPFIVLLVILLVFGR